MIYTSRCVVAFAASITLIPAASATPEFFVDVNEGSVITFSHAMLGSEPSVFDTLIHPVQLSNLQTSLASASSIRIIKGGAVDAIITGGTQDEAGFRAPFIQSMSEAFTNSNLNNFLDFLTFTFDDAFSYELEFSSPLLDDTPAADDDFTELIFTSSNDNSYMLIEALETPGGAALSGSTPFLVDTNGWIPAQNTDDGSSVPQLGGTALYFRGVDLSMLGVSQAQYFRLSSVSTSTPGVTDFTANAAASGLSITGLQTAVPEPSSALLALLGLTTFATRRRRV